MQGQDPEQLTAEQAVAIVANREKFLEKHPGKDKRGRNEAKAPSKNASASKTGSKKKDASRSSADHTSPELNPSSPGKKSARPLSGYNIFCKEMRQVTLLFNSVLFKHFQATIFRYNEKMLFS